MKIRRNCEEDEKMNVLMIHFLIFLYFPFFNFRNSFTYRLKVFSSLSFSFIIFFFVKGKSPQTCLWSQIDKNKLIYFRRKFNINEYNGKVSWNNGRTVHANTLSPPIVVNFRERVSILFQIEKQTGRLRCLLCLFSVCPNSVQYKTSLSSPFER